MMEGEFVECIRLAEDQDDMAYVHKELELKRKSTETKDSMKVVEKEIRELEEKNKKLLQYCRSIIFLDMFFSVLFFRLG